MGFENPGIGGGEGSPFALSPPLLGGVLNGETSAASDDVSGARDARVIGSKDCGLAAILGFPARLMGGGTGGAEEMGRSPFRGSLTDAGFVLEGKEVLKSRAGVESRLGILKFLAPFETGVAGVGESRAACEAGREGRGECI